MKDESFIINEFVFFYVIILVNKLLIIYIHGGLCEVFKKNEDIWF